jgi:hypothetical protein
MPNLDSYWVGISNGETMELCGFCIVGWMSSYLHCILDTT